MIYGEYKYTQCVRRIAAFSLQGVKEALVLLQEHLDSRQDGYFVGYLTYEAGVLLQTHLAQPYHQLYENVLSLSSAGECAQDSVDFKHLHTHHSHHQKAHTPRQSREALDSHQRKTKQPLLYFALFAKRHKRYGADSGVSQAHMMDKQAFETPDLSLDRRYSSTPILQHLKTLDSERYFRDFDSIKKCIAQGESYQINYTQEIHLLSQLESSELFDYLCAFQNTAHKAYIQNPFATILCFSPELFFEIREGRIVVQPMKGTMRRYVRQDSQTQEEWMAQDEALKQKLQADVKNRSENVMIVDLLRNDLSKILTPHSLQVRELCAIHTYPSLHQMVSTLEGELECVSLLQIFEALFPCGSVTGAPKLKSMEHICALESRPRGVYCGALGVVSCEEISMCVPIRTLVRYPQEVFYRYGVGSGVVWDSCAQDEFAELILKSHFLGATPLGSFALFETMLYKNGRIFLLREHLERLLNSARAFGCDQNAQNRLACFMESLSCASSGERSIAFPFIDELWEGGCVDEAERFFEFCGCKKPAGSQEVILRLVLEYSGDMKLEIKPYTPSLSLLIALSPHKISSSDLFVYHKSTQREHFRDSSQLIESGAVFDQIYANQKGELCEGSRSNLVLELDGMFYTPSLESGLLGGVLRRVLLESGLIRERRLEIQDLYNAQSIWCINSVRGAIRVWLKEM